MSTFICLSSYGSSSHLFVVPWIAAYLTPRSFTVSMAGFHELFATAAKDSSEFSHGVTTDAFAPAEASIAVSSGEVAPAAANDTEDSNQDLDGWARR